MIEPEQKLKMEDQEKLEIDKGEEKLLELKWVTLEELKSIDLRPTNIRNMIINIAWRKIN